jgi:hypothetical protein
VRDERLLLGGRSSGYHPQVPVDLHRIRIDHDPAEDLREPDPKGRLA